MVDFGIASDGCIQFVDFLDGVELWLLLLVLQPQVPGEFYLLPPVLQRQVLGEFYNICGTLTGFPVLHPQVLGEF